MGFDEIMKKAAERQQAELANQNGPSPGDTPRIRALKNKLLESRKRNEEANRMTNIQRNAQQQTLDQVNGVPPKTSLTDFVSQGEEEYTKQRMGEAIGADSAASENMMRHNVGSESGFGVDRIYMDATTEFSENFNKGLGNLIKGYGDIAQMVGGYTGLSDLMEGNIISQFLQKAGNNLIEENDTYIPPELQDPSFSFSTLMNPQFWLIHGAQFTPQIVEILATMGAGGAIAAGAKAGIRSGLTRYFAKELAESGVKEGADQFARRAAMQMGKEGVESTASKSAASKLAGVVNNAAGKTAGEVTQVTKGRGLGRLMRSDGTLSNLGNQVGGAVGDLSAGALTNLRVSVMNAGDVYNTYAEMKNENGEPLFTKEELAQMASLTFKNNVAYMGIDMLSWAMTFGGGRAALQKGVGNIFKNTAGKAGTIAQEKIGGALAAKATSPVFKKVLEHAKNSGAKFKTTRLDKWAAGAFAEGLEESIQETHEEWSKMKAFQEATGSLRHYEGPGKKSPESFWDFYMDKELEGTKTIASFLGAAAGGAFNMKTLVDKAADDAHQLNTRAKLFKGAVDKGTSDYAIQQMEFDNVVHEMIFQGQEEYLEPFLQQGIKNGVIDEDKAEQTRKYAETALANREKTNLLNIEGKRAYYTSVMQQQSKQAQREEMDGRFRINREELESAFEGENDERVIDNEGNIINENPVTDYGKAMLNRVREHQLALAGIDLMINQAIKNQQNLLAGKPADPIEMQGGTFQGWKFYYNAKDPNLEINEEGTKRETDELGNTIFNESQAENLKNRGKDVLDAAKKAAKSVKDATTRLVEKNPKLKKAVEKVKKFRDDVKQNIEKIKAELATEENPEAEATVVPFEYKKGSKEPSEYTIDDIDEILNRVDELSAEAERINQMEDSPEKVATLNAIENEINQLDAVLSNDETVEPESESSVEEKKEEEPKSETEEKETEGSETEGKEGSEENSETESEEESPKVMNFKEGRFFTDEELREWQEEQDKKASKASSIPDLKNQTDQEGASSVLEVREQRKRKKGKTLSRKSTKRPKGSRKGPGNPRVNLVNEAVLLNPNESDIEPANQSEGEKGVRRTLSQVLAKIFVGTKNGLKRLISTGRGAGLIYEKAMGTRHEWRSAISSADRFSAEFLATESSLNQSPMWNGKTRPSVIFVHNLQALGFGGEGYETPGLFLKQANVIFISQRSPDQNLTFHHEFLHFNYAYMENTEEMAEYLKAISEQYPELLAEIKDLYSSAMLYGVPRHNAENWSKSDIQKRFKGLSDIFYKQLVLEKIYSGVSLETQTKEDADVRDDANRMAMDVMNSDRLTVSRAQLDANYPSQSDTEQGGISEEEFNHLLEKGYILALPDQEQPVIMEELFVASQEMNRSKKYNIFFEEKKAAQIKENFWKRQKARFDKAFPSEEDKRAAILEGLEIENYSEFTDLEGAVWDQISRNYPSGSLSYDVREQRIKNIKEQYAEEANDIRNNLKNIQENRRAENEKKSKLVTVSLGDSEIEAVPIVIPFVDKNSDVPIDEEASIDDQTDDSQDTIQEGFFSESNKDKHLRSVKNRVMKAVNAFNKELSIMQAEMIAENDGVYIPVTLMDPDVLEQEMFERAKDSEDVVEFIMQMRYSDVSEVQNLMKFLDRSSGRNGELSVLKTFYYMTNSLHNTSPTILNISSDGKMSITDAKTSMVKSRTQRGVEKIKRFSNRAGSQFEREVFLQYVSDMEHIRNTPIPDINPESILRVLKFFGDDSINYDKILSHGFLTVNGSPYGIATLLKDMARNIVKGKFVFSGNNSVAFNPEVHSLTSASHARNVYGYAPKTDNTPPGTSTRGTEASYKPNPYYRSLISALHVTNSQFTNTKSYRDANSNLTGTRMMQNALLANLERMSQDILGTKKHTKKTKNDFIQRYSHISGKINKASAGYQNAWLAHIYDTVSKTGIPYQIGISLGIHDEANAEGKVLNQQTPEENAISMLAFFDEKKQRKGKFYPMDMMRFAGSNRQFLANVPILEKTFHTKSRGTAPIYSPLRSNPHAQAAFEIAKHQAEANWTWEEYSKEMAEMVQNEISYWENQRKTMKPEIRDKIKALASESDSELTPLTDAQKASIADYFYNQTYNGLFVNEAILPGFKFRDNDAIKRAASVVTTYTPLGKNVQNEVLYWTKYKRDEFGNIELDNRGRKVVDKMAGDGTAYILQEDLDRIKNATEGTMNINGHVKMAHIGVEHEGPDGMRGTSQYDKPLYVALNDAIVASNPELAPLYELMKARKAKYVENYKANNNGEEPSMDYANGLDNHILTAVNTESRKEKSDIKDDWTIDIDEDLTSDKMESVNLQYDSIYYTDGNFKGFSGSNIGVQIVMNNNLSRTGVPSQFLSFITSGGDYIGNTEQLIRAQELIYGEMSAEMEALEDIVKNGDVDSITNFIKERNLIDEDKMDQITKMLVYNMDFNMGIPAARNLLLNTIKQYIIQNGNRLSTPGTQARVIPSFAYRKQFIVDGKSYEIETMSDQSYINETTGNIDQKTRRIDSKLKDYTKVHTVINGKNEVRYEPGEMVAPANLQSQGVDSRSYHIAWDGNMSESGKAYKSALRKAKQRGMTEAHIRIFKLKGKSDVEATYGFFVPGDVVMATRIPSHGAQSTGFFEVVDFERSGASQVQVPDSFSNVTGQDFDGDALFINTKDSSGNQSQWNEAFDILKDHWLSEQMQEKMINQELTFQAQSENALKHLESVLPETKSLKNIQAMQYLHTPAGRRAQFHNTLISKNLIGSVMSLHRSYSILADNRVGFKEPIRIGDQIYTEFNNDMNTENESRTILSANIANMILDDIKHGLASKLGINTVTIKYVMPLINMGVSLNDITVIMNSNVMKKWIELNAGNSNMFTVDSYLNNDVLHKSVTDELLTDKSTKSGEIDMNNINSPESEYGILKLISGLSKIQNDMHKMNVVLRGHREMETNSFIAQDNLNEFENFLNNDSVNKFGENDSFLVVNDELRNSPLIQNYRKNAELLVRISQKTDIAYTPVNSNVWNDLASNNPRFVSDENKRVLHSTMQKFMIAQSLGLAGNSVRKHIFEITSPHVPDPNKKNDVNKNIFDRIAKFMAQPIDDSQVTNGNTKAKTNAELALFKKGLLVNTFGDNSMKYIALNGSLASEDITDEMRLELRRQFALLPEQLQRDLALYDLMKHGMGSRQSIFPLLPDAMQSQIQTATNASLRNVGSNVTRPITQEFMDNFVMANPDGYTVKTTNLFFPGKEGSKPVLSYSNLNSEANKSVMLAIENALDQGNEVYITNYYKPTKNSKERNPIIYRISPLNSEEIKNYRELKTGAKTLRSLGIDPKVLLSGSAATEADMTGPERARFFIASSLNSRVYQLTPTDEKGIGIQVKNQNTPKIGQVIASKTLTKRNPLFTTTVVEQRIKSENYYTNTELMNKEKFREAMQFPPNLDRARVDFLYDEYREEYTKGNLLNSQYPKSRLEKMTNDELLYFYEHGFEDDQGNQHPGIGTRNKYAYGKILNNVTKEIATRAAQEQANLIRETAKKQVEKNKNIDPDRAGVNFTIDNNPPDIGVVSSWLMTNNIPSNHPALQAAIRIAKREEKVFKSEKSKYMTKLNEVTAALYNEKFGYNPYSGFRGKVRHAINKIVRFFSDDQSPFDILYGNLILDEVIEEDGKSIKNMRYKDHDVLAADLKAGRITKAEWDFYETTSAITKELMPSTVLSMRGSRHQYIPHVEPTIMEAYSRRGLLGVMVNLRSVDENLGDVVLKYNGEYRSYNEIVNEYIKKYNSADFQKNNSSKEAIEFAKLKNKAIKLLDRGVNEDGSPIRYSDIAIGSTLGDVFMNEFSGERGVRATDLPSRDLNKAFGDYIHGALFSNGNGTFGGFKKLLPLFDGIIANAKDKNHPNVAKYTEKVWRNYFLQGAKQHHTSTPSELRTIGVTSDGAIDYITKASLFYWLGFKGLAIGGGLYAVGNILAGKFTNIRDNGGKAWATGEKRFWLGNGVIDWKDPLAGLKQSMRIMKQAGYMDINIYDDLPLTKAGSLGSLLGDIALMPMAWSEKWIQGVQFLGELTQDEYDMLSKNPTAKLPPERMNKIESSITLSQGRGYQPTDQRMIQMYSFGRMGMQFSRWIPTTVYNQFGKEDFDIYGRKYLGLYQAFGKTVMNLMTGGISLENYKRYRESLTDSEKERLDSAFRGFGLMALASGGVALGYNQAEKLLSDINVVGDPERIFQKTTPPAVNMITRLGGF